MNHICLAISYDGSNYNGFQTQPNKNTIQDYIEAALLRVTGEKVKINGSGRTDAGVHARSQYIDFSVHANVPLDRWCLAMNSCLPNDIVVKNAYHVADDFHARRSALAKTYKYSVNYGRMNDVFKRHLQYHFPRRLNIDHMKNAALQLVGEFDFTSFASTHNKRRTNIRTIKDITIKNSQDVNDATQNVIEFYVTGTGFLQHMVRIMIGTLLDVGVGKKSEQDMQNILLAKNRLKAGPTAPAHGLILWEVYYPEKFGISLESFEKQ